MTHIRKWLNWPAFGMMLLTLGLVTLAGAVLGLYWRPWQVAAIVGLFALAAWIKR